MKTLLLTLRVALCLILITSAQAQSSFEKIYQASLQGDDALVLRLAEKSEKANEVSFGLYYNQGLAHRNLGQNARARASFEKALLFEPRNLSARRRLREVKDRLSPQLAQKDVRETPFWSKNEARILLFLPALVLLGLGLAQLSGRRIRRRHTFIAAGTFAILLAIIAILNPPEKRAVVISRTAKMLEQAKAGSSGTVLLDGNLVEVVDKKNHFVKIKLRDGRSGWLRQGEAVLL